MNCIELKPLDSVKFLEHDQYVLGTCSNLTGSRWFRANTHACEVSSPYIDIKDKKKISLQRWKLELIWLQGILQVNINAHIVIYSITLFLGPRWTALINLEILKQRVGI